MLDAEDEENSEGMRNIDHEDASPYTIHTAVLPKPSLMQASIQGKYKNPYEMDTKIAYGWLWVWVYANHPSFQNCIIDRSDNICDGMNHATEKIIEEAIMTADPDIICISSVLDAKDKENSEGMCNIDHEAASPYTIYTAVLPKPSLMQTSIQQSPPCWT